MPAFASFGEPAYFSAGSEPSDIASADFNGDSDPDLAVTNWSDNSVSILLGGPGGSFSGPTDIAVGNHPLSIAVGDFNGDSEPDLAVVSYFSRSVSILVGDGTGNFSGPTNIFLGGDYAPPQYLEGNGPYEIEVGDFNGDSDPDLAIARYLSGIAILLGEPGGSFGEPTEIDTGVQGSSPWLVVGDFNSDSDPDLVTRISTRTDIQLLLGGAGGSFGAPTSIDIGASSGVSALMGNFNTDKLPDLAAWVSGGLAILLGDGSGGFAATKIVTTTFRGYLAEGRFDSNSHSDLAVAGVDSNRDGGISVLLGRSKGDFAETTSFFTGALGTSPVAAADFNGDSRDDLATVGFVFGAPGNVAIRLQKKGKR